jgi:hypothetical protein
LDILSQDFDPAIYDNQACYEAIEKLALRSRHSRIIVEQFLKNHKYQKNHFTHFALPEDKNLYFRHTQEDLLSFGATVK